MKRLCLASKAPCVPGTVPVGPGVRLEAGTSWWLQAHKRLYRSYLRASVMCCQEFWLEAFPSWLRDLTTSSTFQQMPLRAWKSDLRLGPGSAASCL